MRNKNSFKSGLFNPRILLPFSLCSVAALLAMFSFAGTPSTGTIDTTTQSLTYTAGPFVVPNETGQAVTPVCAGTGVDCDDFTLTVNAASLAATKRLVIQINWPYAGADFDLYVMQGTTTVGTSAFTADPETVILPIPANGTVYTVRVVPFNPLGQSFTGSIRLENKPAQGQQGSGLPPRYMNYPAASGQANNAGEPSIGVDWNPNVASLKNLATPTKLNKGGVAFFTSGPNEWRANFDDCSSPAVNLWENVSAVFTQQSVLSDPIGFVDHYSASPLGLVYPPPHTPGRVFTIDLLGGQGDSVGGFSDNDGNSYLPGGNGGAPAGPDHETLGGGPYHAPLPAVGPAYANAIYYSSQNIAGEAECARSDDGGQTFGAGVPIYNPGQCIGGIHGHIKVSPQGTVYIPNFGCGVGGLGADGVAVSKDNGITWNQFNVPGSTGDQDPSVGVGQNNVGKPGAQVPNTIYLGWIEADGHAHIAKSGDEGATWQNNTDVSAILGVEGGVFPVVVAGDDNRAAFGFIGIVPGTTNIWHLYIATTYDGGQSYILIDATPNDPVQKGTICLGGLSCGSDRNLLDFNDFAVDAEGRGLLGYADGCVNCNNAPGGQSTAKHGTIARQSGGRRLFAAFDPVEPSAPAAPQVLSAVRNDATTVTVSWLGEPDNGGSPITGYNVYRSTTSGTETFLASVPATTNKYIDSAAPNTSNWFYLVTAVNSIGDSTFCREKDVNGAPPPVSACILPGLTILTDPTGDNALQGVPEMVPAHDIQSVQVSEAYLGSATNKIIFTLKVTSLATVPPDTYWPVQFNVGATSYVARMSTFPPASPTAPVFEFYQGVWNSLLLPTQITAADPLSNFKADGTITIVVPKSGVGNPAIGSNLTAFLVRIAINAGGALVTPDNMPDSLTPAGSYTVLGNQACRPNLPPIPILTAIPQTGTAPLTVSFDGSGSNDPDTTPPADTIASYTFNFGDGSPVVTQSSPSISHTYNSAGDYPARLTVTDSRGLASLDYAQRVIAVTSAQLNLTSVVSRKTHGTAGVFDVDLPLPPNNAGIECRSGGATNDHTLRFFFDGTVTSIGSVSLISSDGLATFDTPTVVGGVVTVNLHNVANVQNITVTLNNVNNTGNNYSVQMGVLLGDVTGNKVVSNTDVASIKGQVGAAVTASNFRNDVTANGIISNTDVSTTKAQVGRTLP